MTANGAHPPFDTVAVSPSLMGLKVSPPSLLQKTPLQVPRKMSVGVAPVSGPHAVAVATELTAMALTQVGEVSHPVAWNQLEKAVLFE